MGNTMIQCCNGGSKAVRIYRDKGRILEFYYPVSASKLMGEYPNHLLVQHTVKGVPKTTTVDQITQKKSRNQRFGVRVVRLGEMLEVGHAYFLVNIPDQYIMRFAKYFNSGGLKESPRLTGVKEPPRLSVVEHPSYNSSPRSIHDTRKQQRNLKKPQILRKPKPGGKLSRPRRGGTRSPIHKSPMLLGRDARSDMNGVPSDRTPHRVDVALPRPEGSQWKIVPCRGTGEKAVPPRGVLGKSVPHRYPTDRVFLPRGNRKYFRRVWKPVLESISEVAD